MKHNNTAGLALFAILLPLTIVGCTGAPPPDPVAPTPGPWPQDGESTEDVIEIELREDVIVAEEVLNNCVTVEPDRLVFPASDLTSVVENWPVGAPVLGGRRANEDEGSNNLLGFARKVTNIATEGDSIVVETEPAFLTDLVSGVASVTFDPLSAPTLDATQEQIDEVFPAEQLDNALAVPGDDEQNKGLFDGSGSFTTPSATLQLSGTLENILDIDEEYEVDGAVIRVNGTADFTGDFSFSPSFHMGWDIDLGILGPEIDSFDVSAGGSLYSSARIDFDVDAEVVSANPGALALDPNAGVRVPSPSGANPFAASSFWISKTIKESRPIIGPTVGPFPTTYRVYLYLDCRFILGAEVKGHVEGQMNIDHAQFGVAYDDGDWLRTATFPVSADGGGSINGGGAFTAECGLRPQVQWRIADIGGPYANTRLSVKAEGDFEDICPGDSAFDARADGQLDVVVTSNVEVTMGAAADFGPIEIDFASLQLYYAELGTLWEESFTFAGQGLGMCGGYCDDGVQSGEETDIDCGGPCGLCGLQRHCLVNTDCGSGICSEQEACVATTCEDGRLTPGESDIDCGPACPDRPCELFATCNANADCDTGYCSIYSNLCVPDACHNGIKDPGEACLDGGGTCSHVFVCELGDSCVVSSDCLGADAFCGAGGFCTDDRCADGVKNFDESDVDCGGPTCATRCTGTCNEDSDCEPGNVCGADGTCSTPCTDGYLSPGERDVDCGGVCNAVNTCAQGQHCLADDECDSGVCHSSFLVCVASACYDGEQNLDESSTDCGGTFCSACSVGRTCLTHADCATGVCGAGGTCAVDACSDGVQNGSEADVDCGGPCTTRCSTGRACTANADCKSNICVDDVCVSDRCQDRVRNGNETGVDCSGDCGVLCPDGQGCFADADCTSGLCNLFTNTCVADQCEDGQQNNDETDIDCGGACPGCQSGETCAAGADCASGICNASTTVCAADSCGSGVLDGDETDVDCGGSCATKCGYQQACLVGADCQSGGCTDNQCDIDSCSDQVQNNDETDVDCGGSCQDRCQAGEGCGSPADCISGYCRPSDGVCVDDHCLDEAQNDNETDVDCGGPECGACNAGQACGGNPDCLSNICSASGSCVTDQCFDGYANGTETDIDCGGPDCTVRCQRAQGCSTFADCANGDVCQAGLCHAPYARNCVELFNQGNTTDGSYLIDGNGGDPDLGLFEVYCDMSDGGWMLVYFLNSGLILGQTGGYAPPAIGEYLFQGENVHQMRFHPTANAWGNAKLPWHPTAGYVSGTNMKFVTYVDGVLNYESAHVPLADFRLGTFSSGYHLYDESNGIYFCAGDAAFTDFGIGQANPPPGAPAGCKGHASLQGGYDFGGATPNTGLTASGPYNQEGQVVYTSGIMTYGTGGYLTYGETGLVHAVWVK